MQAVPLSADLSRLLLAFTIELDNEFERRMAAALPARSYRVTSLVMWSNFLRFVGDGIAVGSLPDAARLPKARVLSALGGMERWRYVSVSPSTTARPMSTRRDGHGSARALKADWIVRPTEAGIAAREIWPALLPQVEERWNARFGARAVEELRDACSALIDERLPEYLPIVTGSSGMVSEVTGEGPSPSLSVPLSARLAQVLLAYTLAFERDAPLSLPLAENVLPALSQDGNEVGELPAAAATSPEAISMALTWLRKQGYVDGTKVVRVTTAGRAAADASTATHASVEAGWTERFGRPSVDRLRTAARALLDQRDGTRPRLALGLEPHADGWRASSRYLQQTEAMLADPFTGLPRHPMVLPRGGWPDGS